MNQFVIEVLTDNYDAHCRPMKQRIEIANGKWIAPVSTYNSRETVGEGEEPPLGMLVCAEIISREQSFCVVGCEPSERRLSNRHNLNTGTPSGCITGKLADFFLVGDKPFGVVVEKKETTQSIGKPETVQRGFWFTCARQVHKGELGHRPPITRPQFAHEAPDLPAANSEGKPISARDRRRGKRGWARLTDVAKLIGKEPEETICRYFPFTDTDSPALQVLFAHKREEIHGQLIPYGSWQTFKLVDIPRLFDRDPAIIWIRQGFANVILYLHYFGHLPSLPEVK